MAPIVLYKWRAHAGLPSLTPACLQVEAYLRLAKADFCVAEVASSSATPTGVIPALDTGGADVPGAAAAGGGGGSSSGSDLAAASAIIAALGAPGSGVPPLDGWLSPAQRAEALAFTALLAQGLEPAAQHSTWLEPRGFRAFRAAAYAPGLPFPLNYVVPWSQRSEMARLLGPLDGARVYQDALQVLAALADRLRASPGRFFFGDAPASLDAALWGFLAFFAHCPVAAPVLRDAVLTQPVLARYVTRILAEFFAAEAPPRPPPGEDTDAGSSSWSDAAQGRPRAPKPQPTLEEGRMWRGSRYWLAGAGAAVGAYVLLGGQYVSITSVGDDDGDDDEEEEVVEVEEDDDDGEE